jgi:hypothetical protein
MREKSPVVFALAALGVALVLGFWMRFSLLRPTDSEPPARVTAAPESGRSVRVEERLQMLRDAYARRLQLAAVSKRGAPEAGKADGAEASTTAGASEEQKPTKGAAAPARWHAHGIGAAAAPEVATPAPAKPPARTRMHVVGRYGVIQPPAWVGKNTSVEQLEETILYGTDNVKRMQAIDELSTKEPADAERILTSALLLDETLDPQVYAAVIEALGDYTDDLSPDMLAPALHHHDARVRFEALGLLGDMDSAAARAAVEGAVNDPDPEVSDLARGILEIGG